NGSRPDRSHAGMEVARPPRRPGAEAHPRTGAVSGAEAVAGTRAGDTLRSVDRAQVSRRAIDLVHLSGELAGDDAPPRQRARPEDTIRRHVIPAGTRAAGRLPRLPRPRPTCGRRVRARAGGTRR